MVRNLLSDDKQLKDCRDIINKIKKNRSRKVPDTNQSIDVEGSADELGFTSNDFVSMNA